MEPENVEAISAANVGPSISVRYASLVLVATEKVAIILVASAHSKVTPIPAPLPF